jgi:3',5'-cyclic-AMP phosphodiesterase
MKNSTIIQLLDIHIADEGINPEGVDVRKNFKAILKLIADENYDFLVVSGDLSFGEGKQKIYEWIKPQLDQLSKPYYVISGNHDNSVLLAKKFGIQNHLHANELYYSITMNNKEYLFLDTNKGEMSEMQYSWLKNKIEKTTGDIYIFMHYPPAIANVLYIDNNFAFQQIEKFQQLIFSYPNRFYIFCGHYHVERTIDIYNATIYITPSTYFNLNPLTEYFEVENYLVGYRKILISKDTLITTVKYIDD